MLSSMYVACFAMYLTIVAMNVIHETTAGVHSMTSATVVVFVFDWLL